MNSFVSKNVVLMVIACSSFCLAAAPQYIWLEAEDAARKNFEPEVREGSQKQILSGGKWIQKLVSVEQYRAEAKDGWQLEYDFDVSEPGRYELWARTGYEQLRAQMQWRVDQEQWQAVAPEIRATNLNEVWDGWNEVGWLRAGVVELKAGKHTLTLCWKEPSPRNDRMVMGLDCLALVKGEGEFQPEGKLQPGRQYDEEIDKKAREQVFRFPADAPKPAAERVELSLDGIWQAARWDDVNMGESPYEPTARIPAPAEYDLRWLGITIPSDAFEARRELRMGHRLFYRTQVEIPEQFKGRSLKLHFSGTSWIASVFVNGRFAGGHTSVLVPWDIDITKFVEFGKTNAIVVGIKSGWYAIDLGARKVNRKSLNDVRNIPSGSLQNIMYVEAIYPSSKGEGTGSEVGIVFPVKLVVMGPAYTCDVFVRTSVKNNRLDADVEAANPTDKPMKLQVKCDAVLESTGKVEKAFGPVDLQLAAGKTATVALGGFWENPKLWWPESPAQVYVMRTTLLADGKPIDIRNDTFGFREVSSDGKNFLLNGVRWHFWNWVDVEGAEDPNDWLVKFKAHNNRFHRISDDHSRIFGCQEQALEWLDRHGIAGRKSTCIDGMFITHHLPNPLVWQNFERHVRQVVKAYRNHPSIMMWSLANEMMLITGRLYYRDEYPQDEKRMADLFKVAKDLDPTRDSFDDGAGDLGGLGPINCQHYTWPEGESFPSAAYQYPVGPAVYPRPTDNFSELYKWDANRPLVLGEVAYLTAQASQISWFGGPDVYMARENVRQAEAEYLRICIEGARWQDATAICPWTIRPTADKSFAPIAVFVREQNSCFFGGSDFKRTIRVFNDTLETDPVVLDWELLAGGAKVAGDSKTYTVQPGRSVEDFIAAKVPDRASPAEMELKLVLSVRGRPVFTDSKFFDILPRPDAKLSLPANTLLVYDPNERVVKWLKQFSAPFKVVADIAELPSATGILLVGPNALTEQNKGAASSTIRNWVAADNAAVILEQRYPLEANDLLVAGIVATPGKKRGDPGWMEFKQAGGQSGSICFAVIGQHPVFNNLTRRDFFTWAGDNDLVFRKSYLAPATGALPLVLAGNDMSLAPMLEISPGKGRYLLSQVLIGEKLGVEPTADTLLYNILSWAASLKAAAPRKTIAYLGDDKAFAEMLSSVHLDYAGAEELDLPLLDSNLLVVRAKSDATAWLADHNDAIRRFCEKGGWVMLAGLDKEGLSSFDRLVGFQHRIRPFGTEASRLLAKTDALLLGIGPRDVTMFSEQMIAPWMGLHRVSDAVYTSVVDADNVASFAIGINPKLANGLTNQDFWQYIEYIPNPDNARVEFKFDRPETFTRINLWVNQSYYSIRDLELVFDGNTTKAVGWTVDKSERMQSLDLGNRTASELTILVKGHYPGRSSQNLGGLDEIELIRKLPDGFSGRVVVLTKPAGLVEYPIGKGGIVLNQLDYTRKDTDENAKKKQKIYFNLLRNMGASFKTN